MFISDMRSSVAEWSPRGPPGRRLISIIAAPATWVTLKFFAEVVSAPK